jgi:hypothetical protein
MATAWSAFIVSGFGAWFVLSVLNQFYGGKWLKSIKRFDVFSLIPTWTFFAPRPGTTDFHLLYRDSTIDGGLTPWREAATVRRNRFSTFYHPDKRVQKGVSDYASALLQGVARVAPDEDVENRRRRTWLSLPYLALLAYVSAQPASALTERRQFMIARGHGYRVDSEPDILFVSSFHLVEPLG